MIDDARHGAEPLDAARLKNPAVGEGWSQRPLLRCRDNAPEDFRIGAHELFVEEKGGWIENVDDRSHRDSEVIDRLPDDLVGALQPAGGHGFEGFLNIHPAPEPLRDQPTWNSAAESRMAVMRVKMGFIFQIGRGRDKSLWAGRCADSAEVDRSCLRGRSNN